MQVTMHVRAFPRWVYLGFFLGFFPGLLLMVLVSKGLTAKFDVTALRHRRQWWLMSGELPYPCEPTGSTSRLPKARAL
jgi:hypothetical protein